ncbi:phosphatidylinositol-5-phosphate 4-kinase type-2 gamma [Capsaspora owczarzaki ATCC 30864]|uniref:1-phosphatidylinositol-5-phosphate 4-kinase n=1 Tax=Capsaspora owczarzaki (strain ATCC 30864) TaxID=595528 RepID=A0A0D2WHV0_CAPO3|nr:phosphatidylinositol-5-phosphate 4-kinase type-2 gamma [Capsaspora owczarzaki ATCC 30864]KJE88403.1 phosphatidylinositol-5-phosphate 4-kinase type-2 gamma, variant [Capsaspora owczarzaki ATCC 30864]|eukprot:XP_004364933.1 phosphatidylinositol-5-phosphate 4-kinase type-2 gamma [Capsaspora owczarzaki ATCC 30864]
MNTKSRFKPVKQNQKVFRASDPLQAVLQWGVNFMMNELSQVERPTLLLPVHFKAYSKTKIHNHQFNTSDLPMKFKFKEYCPIVLVDLRERFGVDADQYLYSLAGAEPIPVEANGKSGASFYMTHDKRFIVKSMSKIEVDLMHNILPLYHTYIVETSARTLLPQYVGMYRITVDNVETYLLVQRNVFSATHEVQEKYDLKGSTVQRSADGEEIAKGGATLKDNDLRTRNRKLYLGNDIKEQLIATLERDTAFLAKLKLMDYSFLVGIHRTSKGEEPIDQDVDVYSLPSSSEEHDEVYFVAIIDVLTVYGAKKKAAHTAKTMKHGVHAEISTVHPEHYRSRFLEFINTIVE